MTKYLVAYTVGLEVSPAPQTFSVIRDDFSPNDKGMREFEQDMLEKFRKTGPIGVGEICIIGWSEILEEE